MWPLDHIWCNGAMFMSLINLNTPFWFYKPTRLSRINHLLNESFHQTSQIDANYSISMILANNIDVVPKK